MRLYFALFTLFLPICLSQRWSYNPYPRSCTGRPGIPNCYAPRACRTGHYENTETYNRHPFRFCCYSYDASNSRREEWSLDCRKRDRSNLARTDTSLNVVDLDLSFNDFANYSTRLRDDFLKNFKSLTSLKIEMSHLDSPPPDFLSAHAELERVVLAWNEITELPEDLFANNRKLYDVNLRDNQITHIPNRLFRNSPEMWRLQISGNSLTRLSQAFLRYLPNLHVFDASHNDRMRCMSSNLFEYNKDLSLVRLNNIGHFIPSIVQQSYCDLIRFCLHRMAHLKPITQTYQYLYQCADEKDGNSRNGVSPESSFIGNF